VFHPSASIIEPVRNRRNTSEEGRKAERREGEKGIQPWTFRPFRLSAFPPYCDVVSLLISCSGSHAYDTNLKIAVKVCNTSEAFFHRLYMFYM
jgi:hypothetical protein